MPMTRYEIRNEYSLADPELYQTADKDDPEALLEGVAMAGLVGLLRQLGDLAEFAAEIFHNLHEEVVATAARGHGLMVRVQQLEAEIPSIEKAFLSQTDHSSFFYHAGVDWHPNIRMDQNLVTQGDLPRFIMDSYEECREPPRLFLLDKFDVAGAGACLKRYTDPSFYKVEITDMSNANMQREKKILKAKRKGPRWKNGEVPETLPVSHAKLHQLFLEERVENGVSKSSSRVKLKRRLNGYPFDAKAGKSYMEKILRSSSPDHEEFYEDTKDSTPLMLTANEQDESKSEVTEDRQPTPGRLSVRRKRSSPSCPVREKIMKPNDIHADDKISRTPDRHPGTESDEISSTNDKGSCERVIGVDAEIKREDILSGYHSDDISSEIDYVDAPSTVETEMDTDSEMRVKGVSESSYSNNQPLASDANEENRFSRSDSQSIRDSISDAGSSSSKKEVSSHSSNSSISSVANSLYEKASVEKFPCAGIPEIGVVDTLSDQKCAEENLSINQHSETMLHEDAVTIQRSDFEHMTYSVSSSDSPPTVPQSDPEDVARKDKLNARHSHDTVLNLDDEEKNITDPHSSSVSDSDSQKVDDCPEPFAGENSLHESDSENIHVPSSSKHLVDMVCRDSQQPGELNSEFLECPENLTAEHLDTVQSRDGNKPWVSNEEDIQDEIESASANVCTATENGLSNMIEASPGRELGETSPSSDQTNDVKDNHTRIFIDNQIFSEESNSLNQLDSPDCHLANLSVHGRYVIPEEDAIINENAVPLTSSSCEFLGLDDPCVKDEDSPSDPAAIKYLSTLENLEETTEDLFNTPEKFEDSDDNSCSTTEKIEEHVENICSAPEKLEEAAKASCSTPEELKEPAQHAHYGTENSEEPAENLIYSPEKFKVPADISCGDPEKLKESAEVSSYAPGNFEEAVGNAYTFKIHDEPVQSSCCTLEKLEEPADMSYIAVDLKLLNEAHVLDESPDGKDKEKFEEMASSTPVISDDSTLDENNLTFHNLAVENMPYTESSGLEEPENDKNVLQTNHLESESMVEADQTNPCTSALDAVFFNSIDHDRHEPEVADDDVKSYSHLNLEVDDYLEISHPTSKIQSLPENGSLDQDSLDEGGLVNCNLDAPLHHDQEKSLLPEQMDLLPPEKLDQESSDSFELSRLPLNHNQTMEHYSHHGNNGELILQGKDNLPPDQLGQGLQDFSGTRSDPSPQFPIYHQEVLELNSSVIHADQFTLSELSRTHNCEFDLPVYANDPFALNFPPLDPFTGTDQANLTDLPPLPPLPPVQWRLGKLQQPLSAIGGSIAQSNSSSQEISKSSNGFSTMKQSVVQTVPETKEEKVECIALIKDAETVHETAAITADDSSISVINNQSHETIELDLPSKIENEQQPKLVVPISDTETSAVAEVRALAAEVVQEQSSHSGINISHETLDLETKIDENQKKQLVALPGPENESTQAEDDGVANGVRSLKARLPSPLVDDASVLDKSKLRKVTERVRPELKKVDERDSFLQQIKSKSFNLKPAVSSRPSIRGPSTNLKVAAILEKANAIRQAFAGSDEDEDSWSE